MAAFPVGAAKMAAFPVSAAKMVGMEFAKYRVRFPGGKRVGGRKEHQNAE